MNAFDKIIGYDEEKDELYKIIDMFKNKSLYDAFGATLPKGVLIFGKPGLGKTMMAEALIEEVNVKTFFLKKDKNKDETLELINQIFDEALSIDNCIIFIDDIHQFNDDEDTLFSAIQSGIDKVKNKNVLVIATANSTGELSKSLLRSGRFDLKIKLETPSSSDARKIIEYYLKNKKIDPNLNFDDLAKMINYSSCAELESIINDSAILSAYKRKPLIDLEDITESFLNGKYSVSLLKTTSNEAFDLDDTIFHEVGHAVMAEVLERGSVGFIAISDNKKDDVLGQTKLFDNHFSDEDKVLIFLAGKSCVELFLNGKCASGCNLDILLALKTLENSIKKKGTCGISFLEVSDSSSNSYKEKSESAILAEMEKCLFKTKDVLLKNQEFIFQLADLLKKKHHLYYSDLETIRNSVLIIQ